MISDKQMKILAFPYSKYDALICDGAIRSGKTSIMSVAYIDWAMREFDGMTFIIGGKTVEATTRNVITPLLQMSYLKRKYKLKWNSSRHQLTVTFGGRVNRFQVFGGNDKTSYMLVQGFTAAGCLIDEVALCDEAFAKQCLARCSVDGSRFWFNCNPAYPKHWFKLQWIDRAYEQNAMYLRFSLDDNPALSASIVERYKRMYDGVFYQRYILGEWVVADGLVYQMWDESKMTLDEPVGKGEPIWVSIDYGITNPFVALLWVIRDGMAYCFDEYSFDSKEEGRRLTDEEHYANVVRLIDGRFVDSIVIDPSATSFIELVRRNGIYDVVGADNSVSEGIQHVQTSLKSGCLKVSHRCTETISEFGLYAYDSKSHNDSVIKDNDHAMDAVRYFVQTVGLSEMSCFMWL